jgi:hypothetical protein
MALAEPPIAQSPLPRGAAATYPNRWVAVRHGEIIADADTLEELTADDRVQSDDTLYHVSPPGTYFY